MKENMYKVYYTNSENNEANSYDTDDMGLALKKAEEFRNSGHIFVTMVSQNPNSIGKPGVDSIKDGKCPDGEIYDWKKRRN